MTPSVTFNENPRTRLSIAYFPSLVERPLL
jgi:hypothetical protein